MSVDAKRVGRARRALLKRLADAANVGHRAARASADAAINHAVAAGNALARARDLCDDGEWSRWVRRNFTASLRTAQRYVRLARHWPSVTCDATRVSPQSQNEAARAIRRALFDSERARGPELEPAAGPPTTAAESADPIVAQAPTPAPRIAALAVEGLDRLAASLRSSTSPGDAAAAYIVERVERLAADLRNDFRADGEADARQYVYFAQALGTDRVKIGVAEDPVARLAALQTACPHPLTLLGKTKGGRLLEAALHGRLRAFSLGGEWFYLAGPVRSVIDELIKAEQSGDAAGDG